MYTVMGVTGKVGGVVAEVLLGSGKQVRAVVRNEERGRAWRDRGCELVVADNADAPRLAKGFEGTEGVFAMMPPSYDPSPGYAENRTLIDALDFALRQAQPPRTVVLSTVGGQVSRDNLLEQLHEMEERLGQLSMPIAFLRAAWFMENASGDLRAAKQGRIESFLQPVDRAIPMVATRDIGMQAARMLEESSAGIGTVQLQGPQSYSPQQIGQIFEKFLGHGVAVEAIPRHTWKALFLEQGMKNPEPRMQMLDGFNEGWLDFETGVPLLRGSTTLETVLEEVVKSAEVKEEK